MKMSMTKVWATGLLLFSVIGAQAQQEPRVPAASAKKVDKAAAYFNYSMAHIYSDLAAAYGNRAEYLNQAIDYYRAAIQADPGAGFLSTELSDLYVQAGQGRKAVMDAEDVLKANPKDLSARRILGRIYARLIGDPQNGRIDESMVRKALDQYSKITETETTDVESWVMLGRLHKIVQSNTESEKAYKRVLELDADNEDALTGLAMVAADSGDVAGAASLLERASAKSPNLRSLTALAEAYEQMKDFKGAAKAWQRSLDMSGGNPEIKRQLGNALVQSDQLDEAAQVFEELATDEPKDVLSVLRLSQIYRQKRNFDKAREFAKKAIELDGSNLEVQYNEVNLLEAEGKIKEALATLQQMLKTSERKTYLPQEKGNRVLLLERLGMMQRGNEQFADAVKTFQAAIDLEPGAGGRMSAQLVESYRQAKDFPKAEAEIEAALKKYPDDRVLKSLKGSILAETGKPQQAADWMKQMLDGRADREVYLGIAQVWEKGKNYEEMGKALDQAEKLSLSNEDKEGVFFLRGAMLEKQKKFDLAEAEFKKILQLDPKNPGALNYLGYMLADKNIRLPEALQMIQTALEQDPQNSAYLDSIGWVYFRLNKLDEAEKYLRMSLERLSKDPTVHDHLADVLLQQGKVKEAIGQWEQSLSEWGATAPSEKDPAEVAKVQKKLDAAKVKVAKDPGTPNNRKKN